MKLYGYLKSYGIYNVSTIFRQYTIDKVQPNDFYYLHQSNRGFGTKHVTQKQRYMLRILHPQQKSHYKGKFGENGLMVRDSLPKSLLCTTAIRKLVYSNTANAMELASKIDWNKFKCDIKGVSNDLYIDGILHTHGKYNSREETTSATFLSIVCDVHGFDKAKELAIQYHKRLEMEYEALEKTWSKVESG